MKFTIVLFRNFALIAAAFALTACSPKFDWREIHNEAAPYIVALPSKPATLVRNIDLNGIPVSMTMVASEVDGVTFAVGSAELPDAMLAQVSLSAMKTAMLNNISGTVKEEKTLMIPSSRSGKGSLVVTEIEALGSSGDTSSRILFARFVAKEKRVYQLIATGPEKTLTRDLADTFFTSFKLH